jgi:hypothetical protein
MRYAKEQPGITFGEAIDSSVPKWAPVDAALRRNVHPTRLVTDGMLRNTAPPATQNSRTAEQQNSETAHAHHMSDRATVLQFHAG